MGKSKIKINLLLTIVTLFVTIGCDSTEPPSAGTLTLNLEDVSCTEAWITLKTSNLELPANIILYQNSVVQNNILCYGDTLLYVDSLLPNQSYKFQSVNQSFNQSSNALSFTTMDTSSHNFTFETFTFGEHDASFLWDVAIIDENSIYAVGEIYMNDTLGQPDPKAYNAIHWDGSQWELKRIMFYTFCGQQHKNSYPASSVIAFSESEIWVSMNGDQVAKIENGLQTQTICMPWIFSINKIWGSRSNDLYVVGNNGNVAHYVSGTWSRIESGTETRINDVWGIISNESKTILYCPVSSFFVPGDKKILKVIDGQVDSVYWNRDVRLYSAWAVNENILYVCGEGVYVNKFGVWNEIDLYPVETGSVRGNGSNDIFIVGDAGAIFHFNGVSWKMLSTPNNKSYSKVSIKGNFVVICGFYQGQGLIEIGIRN
jgi:hypothetical protein